jgi:hypothetical protein
MGDNMEDELFISKINEIARKNHLTLPALKEGDVPSTDFLDVWAMFLEDCVKKGIPLSDERWPRVSVKSRTPETVFMLEEPTGERVDPEFRVGLQLLVGLLDDQEETAE